MLSNSNTGVFAYKNQNICFFMKFTKKLRNLQTSEKQRNMATSSVQTSSTFDRESSYRTRLMQGKVELLDQLFPLYDMIFQKGKISPIFYFPFMVWYYVQMLMISFWPITKFWTVNLDSLSLEILNYLGSIFWFSPNPATEKSVMTLSLVSLCITVVFCILIGIQILNYNFNRNFITQLLWPLRLFSDLIYPVLIIPTTLAIGNGFLLVIHGNASSLMWLYIFLGLLSVIAGIAYMSIIHSLSSISVSIMSSPLFCFDSKPYILTLFCSSACLIIGYLLSFFESWAVLIAIFLHIGCNLYLTYLMMFTPFVSMSTNVFITSVLVSSIPVELTVFIGYFATSIPKYVIYILAAAFFIIFSVVFAIVFKKRTKRITSDLQAKENMLTEEDKTQYFNSLYLDKNEHLAQVYFITGFIKMCPCFLDWSLFKYIIAVHTEEDLLCKCLQIINFFPGESRLMNRLVSALTSRRGLKLTHRFLFYQVMKVKLLRQFSASSDSNAKLNELKTMSRQVESITRGIWDQQNIPYNFYEQLAASCMSAKAHWVEAMAEYPNNPKFCEEFCRYLIECECDFPEAIKIKRRGELIEMGKSYSIDYSFRSMIRMFPSYLKNGVLDVKGNMKVNAPSRRGSSSNSAQVQQSFSSSSESTLDDEVEETVGKQTFNQSKTRLALHRALENKLARPIRVIIPSTIVAVLAIIVLYLVVIIFSITNIDDQTKSMTRLEYISLTRFYIALGNIQLNLRYSHDSNQFDKYQASLDNIPKDAEDHSFVKIDDNILKSVVNRTNEAKASFQNLIDNLAALTDTGVDIQELAYPLIEKKHSFIYGVTDAPKYGNESLANIVSCVLLNQRYLSGVVDVPELMKDTHYQTILFNIAKISSGSNELFSSLCAYQIKHGNNITHQLKIVTIIVPIIIFLLVFVPYVTLHLLAIRSINKITKIILSFDQAQRSDAKNVISLNVDNEETKTADIHKKGSCATLLLVLITLIAILFVVMSILVGIRAMNTNDDIIKLNIWDRYASQRLSLAAECLNAAILGMVIADNPSSLPTLLQSMKTEIPQQMSNFLDTFKQSNDDLLYGTDDSEPCTGYDDELDNLNIVDGTSEEEKLDVHALYAKSCINQQISMFSEFVSSIISSLNNSESVNADQFANLFHLTNSHMFTKLFQVTKRLSDLASVEYDDIVDEMIYISIGNIVLVLIFILFVYIYYINWKSTYKASLFVLKRIAPAALINNKFFTVEFLNDKEKSNEAQLSVAGNIIHNAKDAIFCTNIHGVVEIVNNSATNLLEYTPEQLLGQPAPAFFIPNDEEKINQQLELMRSGQSSPYYEDTFTAVSDASQSIPCLVTILGMKSSGGGDVNSFVIIIRDQTVLVAQQKQAEEAKAQSEKLLFQILPRDIVVKLNRGEKDISFSVQSATIIFIDIVRFSEYSATLSPSEIMANLSLYFAGVDKCLSKYKLMTKIKLIGDTYMAAAGLFNPEVPPEEHAEQTIKFAIDFLTELDEINLKLNANLNIRIGVNSGGPIIAGVLGKDKPVFDIIGDPINIAARLQTTDEPNHIQISSDTYDLVKGFSFNIEPRGEVFLKGKGNKMTYFIMPNTTLLAQISSSDFSVERI